MGVFGHNTKEESFMLQKRNSREIYYARVSSKDQNLARQLKEFYELGATDDCIITDFKSGKNFDRSGYESLKGPLGLRPGDVLVVKELDRFGRSKSLISKELQYWKDRGVRVKILDVPTTMIELQSDQNQEWIMEMVNTILIEVLGSLAEQERNKIRLRALEGIAAMPVVNGKRISLKTSRSIGRPKISYPENWRKNYELWQMQKINSTEFRSAVGLKKTTFYKLLKEYIK